MRSGSSAKTKTDSDGPTDEERKQLLDQTIQKREKLAESNLEMAAMFVKNGKVEIARRRLREIVDEFGGSAAAGEAKAMLRKLRQ